MIKQVVTPLEMIQRREVPRNDDVIVALALLLHSKPVAFSKLCLRRAPSNSRPPRQRKIADHLFFATGIKYYCTGTGLALIKISVFFLVDQLVKDQTRLFES